ncbi:MAG: CapA family protein, partial [Phycisphaerales bacterium]
MNGRQVLCGFRGSVLLTMLAAVALSGASIEADRRSPPNGRGSDRPPEAPGLISLFLGGDVMTGRGIDQILPHPSDPRLYEPYVRTATEYVELAERAHGPIAKPVESSYPWGDALAEWQRAAPDLRLINLETSITASDDYWPGKGIHYRMHPRNISCLTEAKIDCCSLANNHVLDWGYNGLAETVATLERAKISTTGAGRDLRQAERPALLAVPGKGRVIVFSYALPSSGVPRAWAASEAWPGVNLLSGLSDSAVRHIREQVARVKQARDVVVVSVHWGSNWGYAIPAAQRGFAHKLTDRAQVDIVHGHSSHHVKGIEVYNGRLILYGAGDFLNDYEGIRGHERFRADLTLMYFAGLDPSTGRLVRLQMTPMQMRCFRLRRALDVDALWLRKVL